MQYTALLLAAAAATASAQVTYNSTTGVFTCPANNPNGAFCASDSLTSNIIIRCNAGIGQPGNCNDNLSGYFPFGVNYAPCWETSDTSGDAACSKNCIVEGGSGNYNGTFTLPNCTPIVPSSPTTTTSSTTVGSTTVSSTTASSTTMGSTSTSQGSSSTSSSSGCTSIIPTSLPSNTTTTTVGPTLSSSYPSNSTITTFTSQTSSTAKPVGPSTTTSAPPVSFTGAAVANSAGLSLAAAGLIAAYFL